MIKSIDKQTPAQKAARVRDALYQISKCNLSPKSNQNFENLAKYAPDEALLLLLHLIKGI
jgi:hypothetical protein